MKKPLSPAASDALKSLGVPKPATPPPKADRHEHRKITISLFDADMEAMNRIIDQLWQRCAIRATRSDAVKLALRFADGRVDDETLREGYRAIKSEDGRVK